MITVLLYGSEKDFEITNILLGAIHKIGASVLHLSMKSVSLLPPDAKQVDFMLIENMNLNKIQIDTGILVFKKDIAGVSDSFDIPHDFIAVTDSSNNEAVAMLQKNHMRAVVCGFSQKDTLTYSSIDSDRAVVSLQREIKDVHGKSICPKDIPINTIPTHGEYPVIASLAVLLLSGMDMGEQILEL